MSLIALADVKADLRLTHNDDDALLQILLDAAEDEAARFLNASELASAASSSTSSDYAAAPSIYAAVFLLVRAKYDAATPDEIAGLRRNAEVLLMPYREGLGV